MQDRRTNNGATVGFSSIPSHPTETSRQGWET
jgi:hypothetical protein